MDDTTIVTLIIIAAVIILIAILFTFVPVALWISAIAAGVKIGIFELVGMSFAGLFQQEL